MSNETRVTLNCLHSVFYDPPPYNGDEVLCVKCSDIRHVMAGGVNASKTVDYRTKCRQCRYGRHYGDARIEAEARASAHHRRYPSHTVDVYGRDGRVYWSLGPAVSGQAAIDDHDEPPY